MIGSSWAVLPYNPRILNHPRFWCILELLQDVIVQEKNLRSAEHLRDVDIVLGELRIMRRRMAWIGDWCLADRINRLRLQARDACARLSIAAVRRCFGLVHACPSGKSTEDQCPTPFCVAMAQAERHADSVCRCFPSAVLHSNVPEHRPKWVTGMADADSDADTEGISDGEDGSICVKVHRRRSFSRVPASKRSCTCWSESRSPFCPDKENHGPSQHSGICKGSKAESGPALQHLNVLWSGATIAAQL